MKRKKSIQYDELLGDLLKDPKEAAAYLSEALEDDDPRVFLMALKDVVRAQEIGVKKLAEKSSLNRENLYRTLSKRGNPRLTSLQSILHAIGFNLSIRPLHHQNNLRARR